MSGRRIANNIRLVLYSFFHFYKAFDIIEYNFMFKALELFGFDRIIMSTIKIIYFFILYWHFLKI